MRYTTAFVLACLGVATADSIATNKGCFSSLPSTATESKDDKFNTSGSCNASCLKQNKAVGITQGDTCHCSDTYPPKASLVDDAKCDIPCPGYSKESCGGAETYSVSNTGLKQNVEYEGGQDALTSSASSISVSVSTSVTASASSSTAVFITSAPASATTPSSTGAESSTVPARATGDSGASRLSSPIGNIARLARMLFN